MPTCCSHSSVGSTAAEEAALHGPEADVLETGGKNFLALLFDLSFDEFVTVRIIRVIYVISIIAAGIAALFWFITFASGGAGTAILGLIVAPIGFLLYVVLARMGLEAFMALFKIAENTGRMARDGGAPAARSTTVTGVRPPAAAADALD